MGRDKANYRAWYKRYTKEHPEYRRQANTRYRDKHRELVRYQAKIRTKRYRENHPEKAEYMRLQTLKTHENRREAIRSGDHILWAKLLLGVTKTRSRKLNIPFNLCLEDILIPLTCPVLGIPLTYGTREHRDNSASIDRIDPTLGYVKGNVIVISLRANKIKQDASPEEILQVGHFFKLLFEQRAQAQA